MKVKLSQRAVIQRINRKLAKQDQKLNTSRMKSAGIHDMGRYYIVDTYRNAVVDSQINLETMGRKLGAIAEYEEIGE